MTHDNGMDAEPSVVVPLALITRLHNSDVAHRLCWAAGDEEYGEKMAAAFDACLDDIYQLAASRMTPDAWARRVELIQESVFKEIDHGE